MSFAAGKKKSTSKKSNAGLKPKSNGRGKSLSPAPPADRNRRESTGSTGSVDAKWVKFSRFVFLVENMIWFLVRIGFS